ncbi:MAG: DUF4249 domain-containing protein [Bacteroidota bacterium]
MMRHLSMLLLCLVVGCQKVIDLDLRRVQKRLVVNGTITDSPGPYTISLSHTTTYSFKDSSDFISGVTGAKVWMEDNLGNTENLPEWQPGLYRTDSTGHFQGVAGRSYALHIITPEGKHYASLPELLQPVATIDSIYYKYNATEGAKGQYTVSIDMLDPPGKGNYYRWNFFINGTYLIEIHVDSDNFFDGSPLKGKVVGGWSQPQDSMLVEVQQMSLSKDAYDFWRLVDVQYRQQSNAPYDTPPAPILGNVYNLNDPNDYALGYFGASGMTHKKIWLRNK